MKNTLLNFTIIFCLSLIANSRAFAAQTYDFAGTIGKSKFTGHLDVDGTQAKGTYAYDKVKKPIDLVGSVSAKGELLLNEYAGKSHDTSTGKFTGQMELATGDFKGNWQTPDGKKTIDATWAKAEAGLQHELKLCDPEGPMLVNIAYQTVGKDAGANQEKINKMIEGDVLAGDELTKWKSLAPCKDDGKSRISESDTTSTVKKIKGGWYFVSIEQTDDGGAHSNTSIQNYYISDAGTKVTADKIFNPSSAKALNALIKKYIVMEGNGGAGCQDIGQFTALNDGGSIEFTDTEMKVYFPPYSINAGDCVDVSLSIPLSKVKSFLAPNVPFGK